MAYKFEEKLKEIIVLCGNDVNIDLINEDSDLVRDFSYNSVNIIQLVVQLEHVFNIEIDDENLSIEKISSYKNILEILSGKIMEFNKREWRKLV